MEFFIFETTLANLVKGPQNVKTDIWWRQVFALTFRFQKDQSVCQVLQLCSVQEHLMDVGLEEIVFGDESHISVDDQQGWQGEFTGLREFLGNWKERNILKK